MNTSSECPSGNTAPANNSLPYLDTSLNYCFITGQNLSDARMTSCCGSNPVQTLSGCYEWCQIPDSYFNSTDGTVGEVNNAFFNCLQHESQLNNMTTLSAVCHLPKAKGNAGTPTAGALPAGALSLVMLWAVLWHMVFGVA
jgi:hypothetical protein